MKKAVIQTGGKQYLVAEGDQLEVELLAGEAKTTNFEPLMVIDGSKVQVGKPSLSGSKVTVDVLGDIKADKVVSIRYKAKKRVHKVRGHRQSLTSIKIKSIQ